MENHWFIVIVTSVLSGLFATTITILYDVIKHRNKIRGEYHLMVAKIFRQVSSEIIEAITPMTSLSLRPRGFTPEQIAKWHKNISELYFKYYTFLPQNVLNEMNCLHSCLQTQGEKLFCIKKRNIIKLCSDQDAIDLFEDTALVGGERDRIVNLIHSNGIDKLGASLKINLQARRVIRVIASIIDDTKINEWYEILRKQTLLQVRSEK